MNLNKRKIKQFIWFLLIFLNLDLYSYDPSKVDLTIQNPKELEGVGVTEKLGNKIDQNLSFFDENGNSVQLKEFFKSGKPVFLTLVYYECPTLCNYHLNGIVDVFKDLDWTVGKQFNFVAISIDSRETNKVSKPKKEAYLKYYGRESVAGWHFLTGNEENVKKIASEVGFNYKWNPKLNQWVHSAVAYVITPKGVISRYLHGIQFDSRTLKLSLIEAADGKIGNFLDKFTLFCFQFDPTKSKYTLYAYKLMQIGGILTVLILGLFLYSFWRKNIHNKQGVH